MLLGEPHNLTNLPALRPCLYHLHTLHLLSLDIPRDCLHPHPNQHLPLTPTPPTRLLSHLTLLLFSQQGTLLHHTIRMLLSPSLGLLRTPLPYSNQVVHRRQQSQSLQSHSESSRMPMIPHFCVPKRALLDQHQQLLHQ
jgi:hypothetical protein